MSRPGPAPRASAPDTDPQPVREDDGPRPGRLKLAFQRFPVLLYRLGLGRLMGKRHLLLIHRGRTSGRLYRTVLEVIAAGEGQGTFAVATMWGPRCDWYRNLHAGGAVAVRTYSRSFSPEVHALSPDQAAPILAGYVQRHPRWSRIGSRYTGRSFTPEAMAVVVLSDPTPAPR